MFTIFSSLCFSFCQSCLIQWIVVFLGETMTYICLWMSSMVLFCCNVKTRPCSDSVSPLSSMPPSNSLIFLPLTGMDSEHAIVYIRHRKKMGFFYLFSATCWWIIRTIFVEGNIFSILRYYHILPTLALLYSHHENNEIVCTAVEVCNLIRLFVNVHWKGLSQRYECCFYCL